MGGGDLRNLAIENVLVQTNDESSEINEIA
jgi:hypothetical protein